MADVSDVENALVALVGAILYPSGTSAVGLPLRIYRGFPSAHQLDSDTAAGTAHVTVFSAPGFSRITGGYLDGATTTPGTVTITATVSGSAVTIGGTCGAGQLVGVIVDGVPYAYACLSTDTPTSTAAALAALVGGGVITDGSGNPINGLTTEGYATVSGSVITFATNRPVIVRVGASGTTLTAARWQTQAFRITTWAPTPASRDAIVSLLDAQLSGTRFITLPDGQSARLLWHNTTSDDVPQKEQIWKRDLLYTVQFATTQTATAAQVLFGIGTNTAQSSTGATLSGPVQTAS